MFANIFTDYRRSSMTRVGLLNGGGRQTWVSVMCQWWFGLADSAAIAPSPKYFPFSGEPVSFARSQKAFVLPPQKYYWQITFADTNICVFANGLVLPLGYLMLVYIIALCAVFPVLSLFIIFIWMSSIGKSPPICKIVFARLALPDKTG